MSSSKTEIDDCILPFQIDALSVRGSLVRLSKTSKELTVRDRYPREVAKLLTSTAALAGALASSLKYKGVFSLQIQGDGPVSLLLVDISSEGNIRGYAKCNRKKVLKTGSLNPVVPALLGSGYLAFTVDQGPDTNRYQGITELSGATLADCAQEYFRTSEQLDTIVALDSGFGDDGSLRSGALLIQKIPAPSANVDQLIDKQEPWSKVAAITASLKTQELLDPELHPNDILYRLFNKHGVRVFRCKKIRHACRCSRQRVATTLSYFPESEINGLKEDGVVKVTCEFCNIQYEFNDESLHQLFNKT